MRFSFDYFVGHMKCSKCGTISPADRSTNMQTKICAVPGMYCYGIGDKLFLDSVKVEESGYLLINETKSERTFKLLDTWECDACGEPFNWAMITIENCRITLVKEIEVTDDFPNCANYITDMCLHLGFTIVAGKIVRCEE